MRVGVLDMTASIVMRRPDAGASTAQSPAERPGEGDDGGCCRHVAASMHALFGAEVQWNRKGNWAVSVEASLWVNAPCPPTADLFGFDRDGEGNCRLAVSKRTSAAGAWGLTAQRCPPA